MYTAVPPKKRIWTSLARQPDGQYAVEVTEEEYALLVKAWVNDWQIVYEDLKWIKEQSAKASNQEIC